MPPMTIERATGKNLGRLRATDMDQNIDRLCRNVEDYRRLVEGLGDMIVKFDGNGRMLFVNPACCRVVGKSAEELLGRSFLPMVHEDDRENVERAIEEVHQPPYTSRVEERAMTPNGWQWQEWINTAILNEEGEVVEVVAVGRDITAQKHAEIARKANEHRFKSLYKTMNEGVVLNELVYDEFGCPIDYRILDINPAYETILGIAPEEAIGSLGSKLYGADDSPYLDRFAEVALTGKPTRFETYFEPMDTYFEISVFCPEHGQFATIFSDMTERKTAENKRSELIEKLESQNAELERYAYTVSHDLKSPLVTISGFVGLLREMITADKANEEELLEGLEQIGKASKRMSQLLDELLELSRVGRHVNPPTSVSMKEIVSEALEIVAGQVREQNVKIVVQPDLPMLRGDHPRLREVFQNLIDNAVKYMGNQALPRIDIGTRRNDDELVCFVRDNGLGIAKEYHENVFELFEKLDPRSDGTGIGLALVQRIIQFHGGRIWVESEGEGCGTSFCFTIPHDVPV